MILSEQRHHSDLKIPMYSKFSKCDICWATNTKARTFKTSLDKGWSHDLYNDKDESQ